MTPRLDLPYPGYNWQLSQHMGIVNKDSIIALLEAADIFRGNASFAKLVSKYLASRDLFTENVRSDTGHSDTWRDYQQVLSELGLIVSTTLIRGVDVVINPVGLMLLDGELAYEEMMTTQAIRYQYPNGYKGLPYATRKYAESRGISKRWILDSICGVKIKPALLVLRALLDAYRIDVNKAYLSSVECATALVPIINHENPRLPFQNLTYIRDNNISTNDQILKRNCAEWFSILSQTSIFSGNRRHITLSEYAINNINELETFCSYHEETEDEFWCPIGSDADALRWFSYYGNPDVAAIGQVFRDNPMPKHIADFEIENIEVIYATTQNSLQLVDFSNPPNTASSEENYSEESYSTERIVESIQKRTEAGRRHEELVAKAREQMLSSGFKVYKSDAIDLLGIKNDHSLIVEAKTVTKRNLIAQTRKGLMQLSEYRFRYKQEFGESLQPETLLLLSSKAKFEPWRIDFMHELNIGCANINSDDTYSAAVKQELANQVFHFVA